MEALKQPSNREDARKGQEELGNFVSGFAALATKAAAKEELSTLSGASTLTLWHTPIGNA